MLCDICGKNPATVHLTEIVDEQMTELHLCEGCAHQKSAQMEQQFGLSDLLAGLAEFGKPENTEATTAVKCPSCGLTHLDFKKAGRLGCAACYTTFRSFLVPLLKKIHGSSQHVGKSPLKIAKPSVARASGAAKKKDGLAELKFKLQKAIEKEAFEEAARLRDEIKVLEKKQPEKGEA